MRRSIIKIFAALTFFAISSCRGNVDDQLSLSIRTDRDVIPADGVTAVTFSVFEGLENVTGSARIKNLTTGEWLKADTFSSSAAGRYEFSAEYNGKEVEETVFVDVEAVVESRFVKNVCLMEFTDASCTYCPAASLFIDRNIMQKVDNVHLMAFHEKDQWASDQYSRLSQMFGFTEQPYAVVDMSEALSLAESARDKVKEAVVASPKTRPAYCGLSLTSAEVKDGKAEVTVKLFSEKSTKYLLAVYIVEDGIIGSQAGQMVENYYHQFVVRKLVSATLHGDNLGQIASGEEKVKEYSFDVDPAWNKAKTYVYVLALDEQSRVNNMQVCLLDGGSAAYEYKN